MRLLDKLRTGADQGPTHAAGSAAQVRAATPAAAASELSTRASHGLADFLWHIGEVRDGRLLDLGPVSQQTVTFFTERGFRVYTEDLLRCWKEHLSGEEVRLRAAPVAVTAGKAPAEFSRAAVAERFAKSSLQYPEGIFHGVLAWDLFDFLEAELLRHLVRRVYELLRPGGVVLGLFHGRKPVSFHRYRVVDAKKVERLAAPFHLPPARVFQNRELLILFSAFRSSKTYIGRDQIREVLFLK